MYALSITFIYCYDYLFSMSFIYHTVGVNNFAEQVIIFLLSKYVV